MTLERIRQRRAKAYRSWLLLRAGPLGDRVWTWLLILDAAMHKLECKLYGAT